MRRCLTFTLIAALLLLCSCQPHSVPPADVAPAQSHETDEFTQSPYNLDKVNQINLVLSHSGPKDSVNGHWATEYKQWVEELSCGKITIDVYSDSILGSELEIARDCQYGTVDIQLTSPAALSTLIPETAVFDVPFLFDNLEQARAALNEEQFFDYLAQAYKKEGLILLPLTDQGFRNLSLSDSIEKLEDFRQLTVRCMYNEHHVAFWEALGVKPVCMDIADVYLALQKGGVQGQENPYEQIYNRKFYEVQKYVTNSQHLLYVGDMHVSKITWDSLSAVSQEILWRAAEECKKELPDCVDQVNDKALTKMFKEGIRLIDFDIIPGMREQCRTLSFDVAYESIAAVTGPEILDSWCAAAGYPKS